MPISITINPKDMSDIRKLKINLPKNVEKALKKDTLMFSKMIQKGAKLRAPRWSGALAESIIVKPTKHGAMVEVGKTYGFYQEFGFKPHYVQAFRPTGSGFVVADWAASKGHQLVKNSIFVKKHKPFVTPAMEKTISQIPNLLSKSMENAINKS